MTAIDREKGTIYNEGDQETPGRLYSSKFYSREDDLL